MSHTSQIELSPETPEEKAFQAQIKKYQTRLEDLADEMAGKILWRRVPARDVALARWEVFRKLNGGRNKAAFDKAWEQCALFQKVVVEKNLKFYRKFVPSGCFGPLRHSAGIMLFENKPENDSAYPLVLQPDPSKCYTPSQEADIREVLEAPVKEYL